MPPKKAFKNILIILSNVGKSSRDLNSPTDKPFIDKVKHAMRILVEKKLFLQPKEEIGIITMGDIETDNEEEVDNVKLYCKNLLVPNLEMLQYIDNLCATDEPSNWIEGLYVALQFMEREILDLNCNVFLVIFNNFKEDEKIIEGYQPDAIVKQLNDYKNLHLIFIGEKSFEQLSSSDSPSEQFVSSVLENTEAQYEQLDPFIEQKSFYVPPPKKSMAWKFSLEWAGISIPCAEYIKTTPIPRFFNFTPVYDKSKDLLVNSDNSNKKTEQLIKRIIHVDQHGEKISEREIINGFRFGRKFIPISEEDEISIKCGNNVKGMMIHSFVPQDEVKIEYWSGKGSRIVLPESNENKIAFYSLVKALIDCECVAIVRKVYAKNYAPKMGVLFPKVNDNEIYCLVHLELPYANYVRYLNKVPIKSIEDQVNKTKLDALSDFIDSMTIKDDDDDDDDDEDEDTDIEFDYFKPGLFPNVKMQYYYSAIVERALRPNGQLLPVNDYIKKYIQVSESLQQKAEPFILNLDKAFEECKNSLIVKPNKSKVVEDVPVIIEEESDQPMENVTSAVVVDDKINDSDFIECIDLDQDWSMDDFKF